VAIGLRALEDALAVWSTDRGHRIEAHAVFVEKQSDSRRELERFLAARASSVKWTVLDGEFGSQVNEIDRRIGEDAAFLFVDPTGWKGADMAFIARLARPRWRDVLINVMFDYLNRWKDDSRPFLREQMRDFFGLEETAIPANVDEAGLLALYRQRLKTLCALSVCADLAVPYPDRDRTFFRLVVGGHHPKVLELFRDVEERVVGREAAGVRGEAKQRRQEERTGQMALGGVLTSAPDGEALDVRYRRLRDKDLPRALDRVVSTLGSNGPLPFGDLWPGVLEGHHLTRRFLADACRGDSRFLITGGRPRDRILKDDHVLSVAPSSAKS
jgi:three-Cys-motif partner protein